MHWRLMLVHPTKPEQLPQSNPFAGCRCGPAFQPSESLKALVYFKGGDLQTLNDKEKSILVESVKRIETLPEVEKVSSQLN